MYAYVDEKEMCAHKNSPYTYYTHTYARLTQSLSSLAHRAVWPSDILLKATSVH